ncbi:MAG: hypothetical protein JO352_26330 [Chloroflexi bacterium]|nr:hypothetical protein [Chloroflexota bacterium]MBV9599188.1 hypothetical protein [Chloroflexota bacterium]
MHVVELAEQPPPVVAPMGRVVALALLVDSSRIGLPFGHPPAKVGAVVRIVPGVVPPTSVSVRTRLGC